MWLQLHIIWKPALDPKHFGKLGLSPGPIWSALWDLGFSTTLGAMCWVPDHVVAFPDSLYCRLQLLV